MCNYMLLTFLLYLVFRPAMSRFVLGWIFKCVAVAVNVAVAVDLATASAANKPWILKRFYSSVLYGYLYNRDNLETAQGPDILFTL